MRFKIGIVGSKFPIFALFSFVFEGSFPSTSSRGAYIWRGDLTEGFLRLPVWGAYTWRGLFSEFYGILGGLELENNKHFKTSYIYCSTDQNTFFPLVFN